MAELLYFGHTAEPLRDVAIPGLGNRYLAAAHDDGWFLMLYYADWTVVTDLLSSLPFPGHLQGQPVLFEGREHAVWIDTNGLSPEEETSDIDRILRRRLSGCAQACAPQWHVSPDA